MQGAWHLYQYYNMTSPTERTFSIDHHHQSLVFCSLFYRPLQVFLSFFFLLLYFLSFVRRSLITHLWSWSLIDWCLTPTLAIFQLYRSWSYSYLIYRYIYNQCLSPLPLRVRIPDMARRTRYNIMWCILSVTCCRLMVLSEYPGFLHQQNWPSWNNYVIVERGIKHHNPCPIKCSEYNVFPRYFC